MMLVGNKIDNSEARVISTEQGEELARKHSMLFIETSAQERIGVNEAFEEVVNQVIESPMIEEINIHKRADRTEGNTRLNYPKQNDNENSDSYVGYCCAQ